jgi:hypothetical protein
MLCSSVYVHSHCAYLIGACAGKHCAYVYLQYGYCCVHYCNAYLHNCYVYLYYRNAYLHYRNVSDKNARLKHRCSKAFVINYWLFNQYPTGQMTSNALIIIILTNF